MSKRRSGLALYRRAYCYPADPVTNNANDNPPVIEPTIEIVSGPGSPSTSGLTSIDISGIREYGFRLIENTLDDGDVPIPMAGLVFNFFGTNYSTNIFWSSNNSILFGSSSNPVLEMNISRTLASAILLGNYDRILNTISYSNTLNNDYSITTLLVTFYDYYTNSIADTIYQYKIRLIKENVGTQRQFVEVYVISSPPSPGYSTAINSYPSGTDIDSNGNPIDTTKNSPYNITNGTNFLNLCGSTFSLASPSANSSFVFSSDSTGSTWTFTNNAHVNV